MIFSIPLLEVCPSVSALWFTPILSEYIIFKKSFAFVTAKPHTTESYLDSSPKLENKRVMMKDSNNIFK